MRVAVLGAGYAGLAVARRLESRLPEEIDLVVVDERGDHLVQHELHRVVRRPGLADDIVVALSEVLDRAEIRTARVTDVDPGERRVSLDGEATLTYDAAAVCLGAETAFYDLPGVEEHATPLKRLEHAETIRRDFRAVLDAGGGRVVVGGAGLSGVQIAGELAAFAREEGAADDVSVVLTERLETVAPGFPRPFREAVRQELEAQGVEIRTGTTVERATDEAVDVADGDPLACDQFVWTGGIRGPDALGERQRVPSTLALDDHTFVVGDAASVVDADGEAVPASAQAAIREARTAATNVARSVEGESSAGFRPRFDQLRFDSHGWLVSVGDGAVAQVGPTVLTGRAAKALNSSVGVGYLASSGAVADAVGLVREELRGGRSNG